MDKFVLIAPGPRDSHTRSVIKTTPECYEKVYSLKKQTGVSMRRILEQCVDFALDHMYDEGTDE